MRKSTTILTTAVLVIVMGLLLVVYLQGNASEPVSGDLTIELYDAPATIHRGNLTVWTNDGGKWTYTTTANGGNTTWVFKGLTNMTSSYDMLTAAASIAGFTVEVDSQVQGLLVTAIDGIENNDPDISNGERAWQFLVDEQYANRACNKYPLTEGSEVVWKYMPNQYDL
ncbi:MAG TPA: DUF4430 domain-containing protein [Euryarchaeota archaeon]|nr:DUF4430 domain-containing protein [Euryarchaeota archaeon]